MSSTRSNTRLRTVTTVISLAVALCVVVAALILTHTSSAQTTAWALLAPVIAIALALITKEVYSSLFIGIVIGALLYARSDPATALNTIVGKGLASAVADSAGIFIFLVILGIIVCMVNRSGGSHAFGRWAQKHIRTRVGAAIATFLLGVMIFIDDYFNCLTVGSVMRPVTDGHRISRVKLAYLIDATAAPICMIAPISSWAAAVSGCVDSETYSGLELFVRAIPYNFYSLLTIVFIVALSVMGFDYGKMAGFEIRAQGGDRGALEEDAAGNGEAVNPRGSLWDLIIPIVILVVTCVCGLVYVGGFFGPNEFCEADNSGNFLAAFGATDAFVGLPWGGLVSLVLITVYLIARRLLNFREAMECIPKGFIAMVPAILILTFATALKNMTNLLDAAGFVRQLMEGAAGGLSLFLPAIIFLVACGLAFATGTSWGTFGILIPIVTNIFPADSDLLFIGISACLAGAVCGDHCSPISDTTIMASAGAQCNHVDHVATQLPYAVTVAGISFVCYLIAPLIDNWFITFPIAVALTVGTLFVIRAVTRRRAGAVQCDAARV